MRKKLVHKVFVYGTLRPHGAAVTHLLMGYSMYNYYDKFPYIVPNEDDIVFGNIVEVDDKGLKEFDHIEGVKQGLYVRESVKAQVLSSSEEKYVDAFVYVAKDIAPTYIPSGDWFHR